MLSFNVIFLYCFIVCIGYLFSLLTIEIRSPDEISGLIQAQKYKEFYEQYNHLISSGQMIMKNTMTVVPIVNKKRLAIEDCNIISGIGFSQDVIDRINHERELNQNNKLKIA